MNSIHCREPDESRPGVRSAWLLFLLLTAMSLVNACSRGEQKASTSAPEEGMAESAVEPASTSTRQSKPAAVVAENQVEIAVGDRSLVLDIAADWESRGRGLGGRSRLPEDGGMIFVYPRAESRSFWMKDCLMGLDIAFVDNGGRLINVVSLDPPGPTTTNETMPRAASERPARFVIETRKGWFAEQGLAPGAILELPARVYELAENGAVDE